MIPRNVKKWKHDVYVSGNSFIFALCNTITSKKMKTKPYPQLEEKPMMAAEPVVAYLRTDSAMYRTSHSSKCDYNQEEVDKMVEEWLQPLTMRQINRWNEEAEEADEADDMNAFVSHEVVVERMKQLMDSL